MSTLFDPLSLGPLRLPNRIVMAPLTRTRAGRAHLANALMAEYYAQRASAGLLIAEATMVSPDASAFIAEPGLYDASTEAAWSAVVAAVHARGGRIVLQLYHPGRAAHSAINGLQPVSASARAIREGSIHTPAGKQPYEVPRPLAESELTSIRTAFRAAAEGARRAGFDGVQIHAAHGYLIDQFLRDGVNDRQDGYGGSIAARARLLLEIVDDVSAAWSADRVSVRISPRVGFNDMADSQPESLVQYLAGALSERRIAFLELRHAQHDLPAEQTLARIARREFRGPLLLNGGFTQASAARALADGQADAIVFGQAFIANPDLVARFAQGAPLADFDPATLYTPGAAGYTDYPPLAALPIAG